MISIEDPIEFVHTSKRGLVNQREVGPHTKSFAAALRSALREDPDVILVGGDQGSGNHCSVVDGCGNGTSRFCLPSYEQRAGNH